LLKIKDCVFGKKIFKYNLSESKTDILKKEILMIKNKMENADIIFDNSTDKNFIDSALYSRQSYERRLVHLVEQIKKQETVKLSAALTCTEKKE